MILLKNLSSNQKRQERTCDLRESMYKDAALLAHPSGRLCPHIIRSRKKTEDLPVSYHHEPDPVVMVATGQRVPDSQLLVSVEVPGSRVMVPGPTSLFLHRDSTVVILLCI
ncbi:unnamed protein product [Eretmochelys imbricata]